MQGGVSVDVIVTAGLSSSRSTGAAADYFVVCEKYERNPGDEDGGGQQQNNRVWHQVQSTLSSL